MANFTVSMPGDNENIIALERFPTLLSSVQCTNSSTDSNIALTFNDAGAFAYAKQEWNWVNAQVNNSLTLVAGAGECGWNSHRQPFNISNVFYDDSTSTVQLTGTAEDWQTVAHSYELWIGSVPTPPPRFRFLRRDWNPSVNLPFDLKLPGSSISLPLDGGAKLTFSCPGCGTTGSFDLAVHIKTEFFVPVDSTITVTPKDVGLVLTPSLGLSANLTGSLKDSYPFANVPLDGITIPGGIFNLGPFLTLSLGYQVGPVTGSATISGGVKVNLDNAATMSVDVLNPGIQQHNWDATYTPVPMSVNFQISASIQTNVKAALQLEAEAIGA
jgi:hypothetical protein